MSKQTCGFRALDSVGGSCANSAPCANPDHQLRCEITVGFDEVHEVAVECGNCLPCQDHPQEK